MSAPGHHESVDSCRLWTLWSLTLFAYRSFDPKRKDVIPGVSVSTRETVLSEVRSGLLALEHAAGGEVPEKIELTHPIPMSPKRKYTRHAAAEARA